MDIVSMLRICGLILMLLSFLGIVVWLMLPGVKNKMEDNKHIPLQDQSEDGGEDGR